MPLIKTEAVAKRNGIFSNLQANPTAQIINCELLVTLLVEVDNGTIGNRAEPVIPEHCLIQKIRFQHEQHGFS